MKALNTKIVHSSWSEIFNQALSTVDADYLKNLLKTPDWLPGPDKIFSAFSLPLPKVQRILFGESPYPRPQSANGYAFWDAAVGDIWSEKGLSKQVNRATSLRNFIKMLLSCHPERSEGSRVQTLSELFQNLLNHGFLLLNATPVLRVGKVKEDAKAWRPFMLKLLELLYGYNPKIELVLLGNIAKEIDKTIPQPYKKIMAEHPYNISFITNPIVKEYFCPLRLLEKNL